MKKYLSIILSLLIMMSAFIPFSAMAADDLQKQVDDDVQGELSFLNLTSSIASANDTYTLFRADKSQKATFLSELDEILESNSGKIVVNGNEDVVTYGAVINILTIIGEDVTDYNGYNIKSTFESLTNKTVSNPYYYRVLTEACKTTGLDDMGKAFVDEFIANYYTLGQGVDYWGYSCDNTALFLTAVAPYKDDYKTYVEDAKTVLAHYTTTEGCFYNDTYTDISPDSTAVTLMAYAAIGDMDTAKTLYKNLMDKFESSTDNGVIEYYGSNNAYATKETLLALTYVDFSEQEESTTNETTSSNNETKKDSSSTSPATGATAGVSVAVAGMGLVLISKKRK